MTSFHFLVIGAGRGGTSLLAGLLDQHPRLEVGFEKFSVKYLMGRSLRLRAFGRRQRLLADRTGAFRRACLAESQKFPGLLWGNKITTEQLYGLEDHNRLNPGEAVDVVDYFFREGVSGVRVVFILRDGRSCVRSKVERTGQSVESACERWKFSVRVYRYLRERHDDHVAIRFEDLLQDPRKALQGVCDFLGVAFDERMLAGTQSRKMIPGYRRSGFDQSRLGLEGVPENCHALIESELRYCGYIE